MRERVTTLASRHGLGLVVLVFGLGYAAFTAPFGVPDEFAHFWRACHVSEGGILAEARPGDLRGAMLPRSVDQMVETLVHYRSVALPDPRIDWPGWQRAWKMSFRPEERMYRSFPATAAYSPVPYLPAAVAIALSRECHLSVLAAFYLARFANVIVVATLAGIAWRRLPCARESFALAAILPMTISQVGSLSADSVSLGIAFLWIALVLDFTRAKERSPTLRRREWLELFAVALLLGLTKFFFPLSLLALLVFFRPGHAPGGRAIACVGAMVIALLSATLWLVASNSLGDATRLDIPAGPALQTTFLREHPVQFLEICARTFQISFVSYCRQIVGVLGWLQIQLPLWLYMGVWIALIGSTGFQDAQAREGFGARARIFCALLALLILVCVYVAVYEKWNAIGAPVIEGVQGRYFIMMLPLLGLASMSPLWLRLGVARPIRASLYAFGLLANGCALFTLFHHAF